MTKKQGIRCIAFVLVVCAILCLLSDLFEQSNTTNIDKRFTTYRNLNKDTIDAVIIGSSGVDRYWISPKAYEEYGMTVYPLSSDAMPSWMYTNMIDEIYTYQNPKLIILDMRVFGQNNTSKKAVDARARRVLDGMDFFSVNRVKTSFKAMKVMHENFEDTPVFDLSYLLSYIKYHNQWMEDDYLIDNNFGNTEHAYLGFYMNAKASVKNEAQEKKVYDSNYYEELDPLAEQSLYELIEYAETNNVELLFLETPQFKSDTDIGRTNTLIRILEEKGLKYINYCETDEKGDFLYELNLDIGEDFYNDAHVNYYGAEKFTATFARYLNENYSFPDHRNDDAVKEQWDGVYTKIKDKIVEWEK